jgi:hypothetical protein
MVIPLTVIFGLAPEVDAEYEPLLEQPKIATVGMAL